MTAQVFVLLLVFLVKQVGGWSVDIDTSAFHSMDECQSALTTFQIEAAQNPDTAPPGFTISCGEVDVKLVDTAANGGTSK